MQDPRAAEAFYRISIYALENIGHPAAAATLQVRYQQLLAVVYALENSHTTHTTHTHTHTHTHIHTQASARSLTHICMNVMTHDTYACMHALSPSHM